MLRKPINFKWEARPISPWTVAIALCFLATRSKSGLGKFSQCMQRQTENKCHCTYTYLWSNKVRKKMLLPWSFRHQKIIFNWSRTCTTEIQGTQLYGNNIATSQQEIVKAVLVEGRQIYKALCSLFWKYKVHSLVCSMTGWKWPVKLLNIQLKIQLYYSHNFDQIRAGKTTIKDMNRANRHMRMKETGQYRTPSGCGTGRCGTSLWLKENHAGLAARHKRQQPEALLTTIGRTADERGGDAHLSILLWYPQIDPSPAEWGISAQAHQKELQLPEWPPAQPEMGQQVRRAAVFPQLAISKHRQCHWNATKNWGGRGRWSQLKSLPTQGNLLLLIRHYPSPLLLSRKGDSPNSPVTLERNRSSNKPGEIGNSTNRAGSSVTYSIQTVCTHILNQDGQHSLQPQPQPRRVESYRSFALGVNTLLSFSYLFQFG